MAQLALKLTFRFHRSLAALRVDAARRTAISRTIGALARDAAAGRLPRPGDVEAIMPPASERYRSRRVEGAVHSTGAFLRVLYRLDGGALVIGAVGLEE